MATMTVGEAITALNNAKTAIATAITAKGGTVGQGDGFADFATDIGTISGGGGKLAQLVDGSVTTLTAADMQGAVSIRASAFQRCTSLTSVIIPSGVTSIGGNAFYNCTSLTSVTIPSGVTSIGSQAFSNCSSLTSITIPSGVTSIASYAFYNCTSLTSVTIPSGVTSIEDNTFGGCSSLTSITIPSTVTRMGTSALAIGTTAQKATITMEGSEPPTIQSNTFTSTRVQAIRIPSGSLAAYSAKTNWTSLTSKFVEY